MASEKPPEQATIFGVPEPARPVRGVYRSSEPAAGYAAPPGTGPQGESCGSCTHCRVRTQVLGSRRGNRGKQRRFYKCGVMFPSWTTTRSSDVLAHSPACRRWEAGQPQPSTLQRVHNREWED